MPRRDPGGGGGTRVAPEDCGGDRVNKHCVKISYVSTIMLDAIVTKLTKSLHLFMQQKRMDNHANKHVKLLQCYWAKQASGLMQSSNQ